MSTRDPLTSVKESSAPQKENLATLELLVASIFIGCCIGGLTTIFGTVLLHIGALRQHYFSSLIFFLPLAGLAILALYHLYGPTLQKGMQRVLDQQQPDLRLRLIPLVTISTWATHLFGGSAGREGVAVQIGATVADHIGKTIPIAADKTTLRLVGMAAGFAGLFQTPLAAVCFSFEILKIRRPSLRMILATTLASLSASQTSHVLGLEKFSFLIPAGLSLSWDHLLKLLLAGLAFGLVGNLFVFVLHFTKRFLGHLFPNPWVKIFCTGLLLSCLIFFFHQGRYAGLGTTLIDLGIRGETIYTYDWLAKILLTCLTLAAGFQGGEVTPLFSIGASFGALIAPVIGLPSSISAALGYTAVFGAATNTCLAPLLMGIHLFGLHHFPAFAIVTSIAFLLYRKQSIYQEKTKASHSLP